MCFVAKQNVERIVKDCKPKPLYHAAHVFFLTPCPQDLLKKLAQKEFGFHLNGVEDAEELYKTRAMDDYKDTHTKGAGNRYNRT
mgnify:CR=1 FL=1